MKFIDLFAGIGGIRLAFERAGFDCVYSNDNDKYCKITYDLNFYKPPKSNHKLDLNDIENINTSDLPHFDLLVAGFPCQPFSIAGYRQGFNDEKGRGNVFFDIIRIIKDKKPKAIFLENVKNLKTHDKGNTMNVIQSHLKNEGYFIKTEVLNASVYGNIPQNRERIYIVGFKEQSHIRTFKFPTSIDLSTKIHDFIDEEVDSKYHYEGKPLYNRISNDIKNRNTIYQWRRQYVRENKKNLCPTLTANMGTGGHNVPIILTKHGIRKLTPRECARFQGFDDSYLFPDISDSLLYKQIGNSVVVPVVQRIAEQMSTVLN